MDCRYLWIMFRKNENINKLKVQYELRSQNRTNRATDKACPLGGRKAIYRADSRRLFKGFVKQTALASIDSIDLDRPWSGAERCAATDLEKYGVEHTKTRFKSVFKIDKRNHRIIKLENNSLFIRGSSPVDGKKSEERKLARVSIVKCSAKPLSVSTSQTHTRLLRVEKVQIWPESTPNKRKQ